MEPYSITHSGWYRLIAPSPKPDIWDISVGNGQHLGWDRCWAYVLSHHLNSREISIVWAIGYAMKDAAERAAKVEADEAYEQGWRDACDDHLEQKQDPSHPIGARKRKPT
jgi:hypothetical protein